MPFITAKKLQQLLEPSAVITEDQKTHISYSNKGPGEMDKWASLLEGKDNCWQQRNTSAKKSHAKKKIILSNHLLTSNAPTVELHRIINALMDNYEVYLWPGDKVNFDSVKPLNSLAEFWEKRSSVTIADQQDVKKALSAQGIATDSYHILDDERCFKMTSDLTKDGVYQTSFTAPNIIDYTKTKLTVYDHDKITSVISNNLDDYQVAEIVTCPNLTTVTLINLDDQKRNNELKKISGKQLNLTLKNPKLTSFECHENQYNQLEINHSSTLREVILSESSNFDPANPTRLQQVTIEHCDNLLSLVISPNTTLNELNISFCKQFEFNPYCISPKLKILNLSCVNARRFYCPEHNQIEDLTLNSINGLKSIDLSTCKKLKKLSISDQFNLEKIIFPHPNNIEELVLFRSPSKIDLGKFAKLKKLTLVDPGSIDNLDFSIFPDLEEITISVIAQTKPLDLSSCKKLKNINIAHASINCENINNIIFGNLTSLKNIKLTATNFTNLDLSQCHSLENIKLSNCDELKSINLSNLTKLKKIETEDQTIPDIIQMQNCSKVTHLILQRTKAQENIDLSSFPNLEKVEISIDEQSQLTQLSFCNKLQEIELHTKMMDSVNLSAFENLKKCTLAMNKKSKSLTVSATHNLENLIVASYKSLEHIDLSNCAHIKDLLISKCKSLLSMQAINLSSVEKLCIDYCNNIIDFSLENLKTPNRLAIQNCENILTMTLNNLTELEELEIFSCKQLNKFELKDCPKLKHLKIESCNILKELDLKNLSKLKSLAIKSCDKIDQLSLNDLSELEELEIDSCQNLKMLDLNNFPKLKRLKITNCNDLKQLSNINLPMLEVLEIHNCRRIKKIDFSSVTRLKALKLTQDIDNYDEDYGFKILDLQACTNLEILHIKYNNINDISLQNLSNLRQVDMSNVFANSINLNGTTQLNHFSYTNISLGVASDHETKISLSRCNNLETLALDLAGVVNVDHLEDCKQLKTTNLTLTKQEQIDSIMLSIPPGCKISQQIRPNNKYSSLSTEPQHTSSNMLLHQQNQINPVSRFRMSDAEEIDSDTQESTESYSAGGNFTVEFIGKKTTDTTKYRIFVRDVVTYEDGKIRFTSNIQENLNPTLISCNSINKIDIPSIIEDAKNSDYASVAYFTGELVPGEIYPLPSSAAMSEDHYKNNFFANTYDKIDICWHPEHQQYYIKLKPEVQQTTSIEMMYLSNNNIDYINSNYPRLHLLEQSKQQLLPQKIIDKFDAELEKFPGLNFLFDNISQIEKLNKLIQYCADFKNEALLGNPHTDIDAILDCIWEQKGACRHRSNAFVLLARYIGIPARLITNEQHAFCEIAFPHDNPDSNLAAQWFPIDLGGAFRMDLTPESMRQCLSSKIQKQTLSNLAKQQNQKSANSTQQQNQTDTNLTSEQQQALAELDIAEEAVKALHQQIREIYISHFDKLVKKSEADSVATMLNDKTGLAPLIELSAKQTPFNVNRQIIQQLNSSGYDTQKNYLFINSPNDFKLLLAPYRLNNGKREQVVGPLQKLIDEGGIITVNWANFSHTELASYKSILDKPPTLLSKPVSQKLTVIGLTAEHTEACTAFSSRCKTYKIGNDFFKTTAKEIVKETNKEPVPIDLFASLSWKEKLLGKITFVGDQIILSEGPLLQAINENRPLQILNPPDDNEFKLLLHRLTSEKQFLYNGQMKIVPEEFIVSTAEYKHADSLDNVKIILENSNAQSDKAKIYLGLYNIHECLEQLVIDKSQNAHSKLGFFNTYDSSKQIFYITEYIPKSDWQFLLTEISKTYPDKNFEFMLAPGVEIEGVKQNTELVRSVNQKPHEVSIETSGLLVSNDPHYLSEQIAEKYAQDNKPIIIDITPQTDFTHLIAEMTIDRDDKSDKVKFNYQEKQILAALKTGKAILLNGALSSALYQQLLPLFESSGHFHCNGQDHEIRGKLISVQPLSAKNNLPLMPYQEMNYTRADYLKYFSKEDAKYIEQIYQFYDLAEKLPHKGAGTPTSAELSLNRLKEMVHLLKKGGLHAQNPIKGVFHYDYMFGSEDYYYLNVMAKYHFSSKKTGKFREQKFRDILALNNITDFKQSSEWSKHLWKILNCFSGAELKILLGDDLTQALDKDSTFPKLSKEKLTELSIKLQSYLEQANLTNDKSEKKSHIEKREQQLSALLADDNTHIIVLKGPPGVGKTHTIRAVINITDFNEGRIYEGEQGIIDWLVKGDKILLLDEANLALPGTWDFLSAVQRGDKTIYYQGKAYPLKPNHQKIIATINPENYPKREYHRILQHQAETLRFEMPENDFLEKHVLGLILSPYDLNEPQYTQALLKAYEIIRIANPTYVFSNRDLESLALRFIATCSTQRDPEKINVALWQACVGEFAGTLVEPNVRAAFVQRLANQFNIDPMQTVTSNEFIVLTDKCKIHPEKTQFIASLQQDLVIRQQFLDASTFATLPFSTTPNNLGNYKAGILIEGDAGLGKSTLLQALLEKNGFRQDASDTQKRYYVISAGDEDKVSEILIKAFHEGAAVILDEINLDENLEQLLNQLMSGVDHHGKTADKKGFMIFSSQNPSFFAGRQSVSQAIRNRMHMVYMDPYSNKALTDIAKEWHVAEPELFVEAFVQCKEANMRTFYTLLASPEIPKIKPPAKVEVESSQSQKQEINKAPKLRLAKMIDYVATGDNLDHQDQKMITSELKKALLASIDKVFHNYFGKKETTDLMSQYQKALINSLTAKIRTDFSNKYWNTDITAQNIKTANLLARALGELSKENNPSYNDTSPSSLEVQKVFTAIIEKWPHVDMLTSKDSNQDELINAVITKMKTISNNPLLITKSANIHQIDTFVRKLNEVNKHITQTPGIRVEKDQPSKR